MLMCDLYVVTNLESCMGLFVPILTRLKVLSHLHLSCKKFIPMTSGTDVGPHLMNVYH